MPIACKNAFFACFAFHPSRSWPAMKPSAEPMTVKNAGTITSRSHENWGSDAIFSELSFFLTPCSVSLHCTLFDLVESSLSQVGRNKKGPSSIAAMTPNLQAAFAVAQPQSTPGLVVDSSKYP